MIIEKTPPEVGGMGHSIKRKEDSRFIQGKATTSMMCVFPAWFTVIWSEAPMPMLD